MQQETDTVIPPKPPPHIDARHKYASKAFTLFLNDNKLKHTREEVQCPNHPSRMKRGCLLKQKSGKERGMHLLKDVLAPSELVVGWRKVGMSWIKAKGEATSKTLESTSPKIIHITQTSISPGISAPT